MDQEQLQGLYDKYAAELIPLVIEIGTDLIAAVLILILGFWVAGRLQSITKKSLPRPSTL